MTVYQVRPDRFALLEVEAQPLVSTLVTGGDVDLEALTKSLGATLEFMLCDLFPQHESTRRYWCDGVDVRAVELLSGGSVRVQGLAWCAEDSEEWQVPAEITFVFSSGPPFAVSSLTFRVGDAAYPTLGAHRGRRPRRMTDEEEWLHELLVQCPVATPPLDAPESSS